MINEANSLNAFAPHIVVLDVGHGNATLLHEDNATLLIDAATRSHVLEYLRRRSIKEIDLVILSHSDIDHIGGLTGILSAGIRVKTVRVNADADKETEAWRDLIFALEDARRSGELRFEVGLSNGKLQLEGFQRCGAEIVAPTPGIAALGAGARDRIGRKITSNSISACIRISFDGAPVILLGGDMDEVSLDDASSAETDLVAPILVFPHHGGLPGSGAATSFASKLIRLVRPTTVLFSHGRSRHDNPRPEIVAEVCRHGAYVACTQLSKRCSEHSNRRWRNIMSFPAARQVSDAREEARWQQ